MCINDPVWMIAVLDKEAKKVGLTRQSVVKVRLAEKLQAVRGKGN